MIEDKYINQLEEIIMEPECEAFTPEQREEVRNVLYGFYQDIKAKVIHQSMSSFKDVVEEAFKAVK